MNCTFYKDGLCLKFGCECVLLDDFNAGCADAEPIEEE